jgi:hypothetical protein
MHSDAVVADSGAYKVFELPGHGAFAKVGPQLEVTEVVSILSAVIINRGRCTAAPPPLIRTR